MEQLEFINRIATDKNFRDQLRQDPKAALAQSGENIGDVEIKVVQDTASVRHITMPHNPNELLDDSTLERVSAGSLKALRELNARTSSVACLLSTASSAVVSPGVGRSRSWYERQGH